MRFEGTRNTFRCSLEASAELGLTFSFTVATVALPAVVPLRTLLPLPLPLPEAAAGVSVVPPDTSGPPPAVAPVDPAWLEGTRLSGDVVHFKSILFRSALFVALYVYFFPFSFLTLFAQPVNKLFSCISSAR